MVQQRDTAALTLLREKADFVRTSATLADERANEAWDTYRRYSDRARETWREHVDLVEAIRTLESGDA